MISIPWSALIRVFPALADDDGLTWTDITLAWADVFDAGAAGCELEAKTYERRPRLAVYLAAAKREHAKADLHRITAARLRAWAEPA